MAIADPRRFTPTDLEPHLDALRRDGITALKGAFSREWVEQMRQDMLKAFWAAIQRPGGAIGRGPQYDDGREWKHEMFPEKDLWPRFAERGVRKFPQMGDISARSALTIHRGTKHDSPIARPVLVLGVDAPGAGHAELHDMMVTQDYYDALPEGLRQHLVCRVVDELVPIVQKHDIEGLMMG